MTLTQKITEQAQGILNLQKEVRDEGNGYMMFDDGGVETEVGEFLYGMIRILKPKNVLTTGIYTGISDSYIGEALKDNGFGLSTALEFESFHLERARKLWEKLGLLQYIDPHLGNSLNFTPTEFCDFMFLDTEPHIRFQELVQFYPWLNPGGYVFIHDLPRGMTQGNINPDHPEIESWPFGNIPEEMKNWIKDGELATFHFPNPRGLVGFYKRHPSDYRAL